MSKTKIIVDYSTSRYTDSELNVKARIINSSLTANDHFPTLADAAGSIKQQNDLFTVSLENMKNGGKQATLDKNNAREILETLLRSTAISVQEISGGNESLILEAGFDVSRKPVPVGILDRPVNLRAKEGPTRGSLEINWDVVENAYVYEVEYTKAPSIANSVWKHLTISKHRLVINDLMRGEGLAIRVAAVGSDPSRNWSDEIISYVM